MAPARKNDCTIISQDALKPQTTYIRAHVLVFSVVVHIIRPWTRLQALSQRSNIFGETYAVEATVSELSLKVKTRISICCA